MPPDVIELRHRLLQRYGLLFRGRRLVCRGCLGVRYGEVRKSKTRRSEERSADDVADEFCTMPGKHPAHPAQEDTPMEEQLVGTVTHYFGKVSVAGIELTEGELHVGDTIHIVGHTSDFTQTIDSMQIDGIAVESAGIGDRIGVRVIEHARDHDKVYKVVPG